MRRLSLLALVVLVAACAGVRATPEIRYYVLAVPNGDAPTLAAPVHFEPFTIDDPYATRQLAYRTSPYRLAYYSYHRWAGSPEVVVAAATREYLEHAGEDAEGEPFNIHAHVRRLEEFDDDDDTWSGALAIEFTVRRSGEVVLERGFEEIEPAKRRNPEAVVAALSRALKRILRQLTDELAALDDPAP